MNWLEQVRKYFPEATEQEADFILWNMTCYPFSTEQTIKQLEELGASSSFDLQKVRDLLSL